MLKELTLNSTVYLVTGCSDLRKGIEGPAAVVQEHCPWIRSTKACICSAVAAGIGSKDYSGRETDFFFSANAWTAECSVGREMKQRQDFCPNRRSVGCLRAWSLNSQRQLRKQSREYCIKMTDLT